VKNPWGLTPREFEVMERYTVVGLEKIIAADLGISPKTVNELVRRAKRRIGERTIMLTVLTFDRAQRGAA
jgi:DNA-binding CsgD family transcriptional regulator